MSPVHASVVAVPLFSHGCKKSGCLWLLMLGWGSTKLPGWHFLLPVLLDLPLTFVWALF
jgi:hypothetical protein